jgi:hypothetical protein
MLPEAGAKKALRESLLDPTLIDQGAPTKDQVMNRKIS